MDDEKRKEAWGFGETVLTVHLPAKGQNPKTEETAMIYFIQMENESVCNQVVALLQKLDKLAEGWWGILLFTYLYLSDIWNILPM